MADRSFGIDVGDPCRQSRGNRARRVCELQFRLFDLQRQIDYFRVLQACAAGRSCAEPRSTSSRSDNSPHSGLGPVPAAVPAVSRYSSDSGLASVGAMEFRCGGVLSAKRSCASFAAVNCGTACATSARLRGVALRSGAAVIELLRVGGGELFGKTLCHPRSHVLAGIRMPEARCAFRPSAWV